jgi:hypothetical protein
MAGAGSFMQGMADGMGLGMQYRRQQQEEQQDKKIDQASAQPDIQQQASTLESLNRVISDQGKVSEYVASEEAKRDQQTRELREMQERFDSQGQNTRMNNGAGGGQAGGSGAGSFMTSFAGNVDPSKLQGMFGGGGSTAAGGASAAGGSGGAAGGAGGGGGGFGLSSIFGGGSAAGGGAGAAGGSSAAGGAASSGAGGLASAGPWAALAAVILANESNARDNDYRNKDDKKYAQDLLGGAVLEQDLNQRWLPKIYGKDLKNDKLGLGHDQKAIGEFGSGDFSNGFKALEDGTLGKIAKGIKKLF